MNFSLISTVLAAETTNVNIGAEATKNGFFGYTCIGHLVSNIAAAGFIASGVAFFLILVMGGMNYLTSGGDKGKITESQQRITAGLIGLAIVASSYAIYTLVLTFFGINLDNLCTSNPIGN